MQGGFAYLRPTLVSLRSYGITVGFTYLFGLTSTRVHTLMVVALTTVVTSILFTIYTLEHRFSGDTGPTPAAFEEALKRFEGSS
jgi:hypothetical protein